MLNLTQKNGYVSCLVVFLYTNLNNYTKKITFELK